MNPETGRIPGGLRIPETSGDCFRAGAATMLAAAADSLYDLGGVPETRSAGHGMLLAAGALPEVRRTIDVCCPDGSDGADWAAEAAGVWLAGASDARPPHPSVGAARLAAADVLLAAAGQHPARCCG